MTALECLLAPPATITPHQRSCAARLQNMLDTRGIPLAEYTASVAAGLKLCRRCWDWKMATDANFYKSDAIYCRACYSDMHKTHHRELGDAAARAERGERVRISEAWGRLGYWSPCAKEVPPYIYPLPRPDEHIGCLECRHCQLLPHTDFRKYPEQVIPIYCGKTGRAKPCEFGRCEIADPRPPRPKGLNAYWNKFGPLGDAIRTLTPVCAAYLRARWPVATKAELEKATGHTYSQLRRLVKTHGLGGEVVGATRRHLATSRHAQVFSAGQKQYLKALFFSPQWPRPLRHNLKPEATAERLAERERVLTHLSTLGPDWTWKQVATGVRKWVHEDRPRKQAQVV